MPTPDVQRWTFTTPMPTGDVRSVYEITEAALRFESDHPFQGGSQVLPWDAVEEAGIGTVAMPVGKGAPDLGRYVPGQMAFLIASRRDAPARSFMAPLPPSADADVLVAAVRSRVGARWLSTPVTLDEARTRFRLPKDGGINVVITVLGVLGLLVLLLIATAFLFSPIVLFPASWLAGGWLVRRGLSGLRDGMAASNTPTARAGSAALGLVELEGVVKTAAPTRAAVSGRPSAWWDVVLEAWHVDGDHHGEWRQLASRHGGVVGVFDVEDATGRVPVWVKDAELLLTPETWESRKDPLPASGDALLETLGFSWTSGPALRLRETRLEVDAPVYVLGTLDERHAADDAGPEGPLTRMARLLRSGAWKGSLARGLPRPLALIVTVTLGFLGILFGVGRGGDRVHGAEVSSPPDIAPEAVMVWKGRASRPFIVSNRREAGALAHLRSRSLLAFGAGTAILCYSVYELVQRF